MRRLFVFALAGASLSISACGKSAAPAEDGGAATPEKPVVVRGAESSEALARSVIDALAKKDKAAFLAHFGTLDEALKACPAMEADRAKLAEHKAKDDARAAAAFDDCAKIDFASAKIVSVAGGETKRADDKCPGVTELKDIEVTVEIGGAKRVVKLDDPVKLDGRTFLWDAVECGFEAGEPVAALELEKPAADKPAVAAAPAATGVASATCDKFIKSYEACVSSLPAEAQGPARDGLKSMREQFAKITDQSMLDQVCTSGYEQAKKSMGSFCPTAFP